MKKKHRKTDAKKTVKIIEYKKRTDSPLLYSVIFDAAWKRNVRASYMRGESIEQKDKTKKTKRLPLQGD